MTKSKTFKIFLFSLVAVFAIGVFAAFAACGDDDKTSGNGEVILETEFFAGYGCTIAWTFKDDGTVDAVVDGYSSLNGTYEWAYTKADETEMTVYSFGEGDPDWTIELLSYNDEVIALYITSDSPAGLTGPYVAYPSGITAALQTQDEVMNYTGNIIVLYDSGTLNYYWSTSTFPSEYTISGSTLTFTVNGSETTGELTFDTGGFIDSLTIGSMLGATDIYFTPYGLEVEGGNNDGPTTATVIADLTSTTNPTIMTISAPCQLIFYDDGNMTLNFFCADYSSYADMSFNGTYTLTGTTLVFSAGNFIDVTGTATLTDGVITQIEYETFCGDTTGVTFTTTVVAEASVIGDVTSTADVTIYGITASCQLVFYNDNTMTFYFYCATSYGSDMVYSGSYSIDGTTLTFSAGSFSNQTGTVTLTDGVITGITFTTFCNGGEASFTTTVSA